MLGGDVCQRVQLKRYGGHGYSYVSEHFVPALSRLGVSDDVLRLIMVENPARALIFREPRPAV